MLVVVYVSSLAFPSSSIFYCKCYSDHVASRKGTNSVKMTKWCVLEISVISRGAREVIDDMTPSKGMVRIDDGFRAREFGDGGFLTTKCRDVVSFQWHMVTLHLDVKLELYSSWSSPAHSEIVSEEHACVVWSR